jgi:DNA modification methylase
VTKFNVCNATEFIGCRDIDLLYIDPPYLTGKVFKSGDGKYMFEDKSCEDLRQICLNAHQLLSPKGIICVHVDHRLQHHVRNWLEECYGKLHFVNQIIWTYKTGGSTNKRFSRKHDYIIVYSNSKDHIFNPIKERSYNREFKPYRFKGVEEYCDEEGKWYTMVNMKDVWSDIPAIGRTSKERNNYPTQKPLALMSRLINAFSNEGDLCADLFCGSGSFIVAANELKRDFVAADISENAIQLLKERLGKISD